MSTFNRLRAALIPFSDVPLLWPDHIFTFSFWGKTSVEIFAIKLDTGFEILPLTNKKQAYGDLSQQNKFGPWDIVKGHFQAAAPSFLHLWNLLPWSAFTHHFHSSYCYQDTQKTRSTTKTCMLLRSNLRKSKKESENQEDSSCPQREVWLD